MFDLKKLASTVFLFSYLSLNPSLANADNFPLGLKEYHYGVHMNKSCGLTARNDKNNLEEKTTGSVNARIFRNDKEYFIDLEAKCSKAFVFNLKHNASARLFQCKKRKSYRSKEFKVEEELGFFILPSLPFSKLTYSFNYPEDPNGNIQLGIKKTFTDCKNLEAPCNTQDPFTLMINLLSNHPYTPGVYDLGRMITKEGKITPNVYATVSKDFDGYIAELTFPENTLLDNKAPFKIHYTQKNGKVDISKINLFISKFPINSWIVSLPSPKNKPEVVKKSVYFDRNNSNSP